MKAVREYPLLTKKKGAFSSRTAFSSRFRFLFCNFHRDGYFWQLSCTARGCFLALLPVICPDAVYLQIILAMAVLWMYFFAEASLMPWRTNAVNYADMVA